MSSDDIYLILFSIQQKTKWYHYFNKLEACNCDLVSFLWFPSKLRNLLLAKSQPFFFFFPIPGPTFWLAWEQLPVLCAANQSRNVLTLRAWLHPTQGAERSHFFTHSLCQAAYRSPAQTGKLTASSVSSEEVPMSVRETVNILEESMAQWKILLCVPSKWKKEHFWSIRKPKVPLFTCSLKAKPIYSFVWSVIWLRTQTNKKRNRKVFTDECQQLFYCLCVSKNSLFYWKPHTTTTPGYAPFYSGIFWINFLVDNSSNQDSRCSHHKKGSFPKLSACIEHLQKCHGHSDNRAETWRRVGTFQVSEWNVNPLKWLGNFTDILPFAPSGRAAKEKTKSKPILGFQLWVFWCGNCIFL